MKPFSEQDHYEILEVGRDASEPEIERAYRMAQSIFGEDSLAGYSVFAPGESQAIRERLETAYRILSDLEARQSYDSELGGVPPTAPRSDIDVPPEDEPAVRAAARADRQAALPIEALGTLDEAGEDFDGGRLRRTRLHRALEIEDISRLTKINPAYLRFIEADRFEDLPAPVYVRGFVRAFADCLGLDPDVVAPSYMARFEQATTKSPRGRFLAGR